MDGFFNILKPTGLTSNDVVVKIKRMTGQKDIGHMGTLDPFGSGVLPVMAGRCTRLFDFLQTKTKKYRAAFCFGYQSDTLDSAGNVEKTCGAVPAEEEIISILSKLTGKINQIPPAYSAKKINGTKAYILARNNVDFELKARCVEIYDIKLIGRFNERTFIFDITCSGGTYIRSVCRDMAQTLDTTAIMSNIIRLESGGFKIENSMTLEELSVNPESGLIRKETVLKDAIKYVVPDDFFEKLKNGVAYVATGLPQEDCVVECKNIIFGIGCSVDGKLKLKNRLF